MIIKKFSKILKKPILIIILVIASIVILGGLRVMFYFKSPNVVFLSDRAGAQWIRYDSEFELEAKKTSNKKCEFKYIFNTNDKIDNASITVQALKSCQVFFDGINIFSSTHEFNNWKKVHNIAVPFAVKAGQHEILIIVTSENSRPTVIAYSDKLPIRTGSEWFASIDGKSWQMAVPASEIKQPAISKNFPSSVDAFVSVLPYLAAVFVIVMFISFFASWNNYKWHKFLNWGAEPSCIRWILLFLWAVLSVNNMFKLNYQVGTDGWGHIEYINYIVTKGSLPLANDGWQMFQPPLNYILSAPLYNLLIKWFDFPSIVKMMVIIPVICGLLQIEIVYRIGRLVFADRKDLQLIAIITGSLLPIHTYACQSMGNEPLVACFMSLLVFFCISLIMPDQKERQSGYFVLIGFVWGLALLSKASAVVLAPILVVVMAFHVKLVQKPLNSILKPIAIVFGVSIMLAGWYYFRNYIKLGSPLAGMLDNLQMQYWWQDPSYRTWSQILSFGNSFGYPVYSGVTSFWDTLYSTLWLDGINSGLVDFIPWNEKFMIAGALLGLLPSLFIIAGVISAWWNKGAIYRNAAIFSTGTIALFVAAMMDLYIVRQAYSVTKASYTLGLLPCYAILVAAGMEPFFRNRIIRSFAIAFFVCWAFAAYAAYFVIKFQ
jgi:hypothetical protein